jgi:DNA-binding GntR family transcriptional regulator
MALERTSLPRTAQAIAADELRAAIVRGDISPGAKIRQEATARELGVSLIPLREALRTLASEGTLTYRPQRGYFVTEMHDETIRELYEARALLEAHIESIAVALIDEEDIAVMRDQLRIQERAVEDRDAVEMIAANRRLHFTIFNRCENPWLLRFVTQLWDSADPYRVLAYRRMWLDADRHVIPAEVLAEHERIVDALERGKHDRVVKLLERHRERSEVFLQALTQLPEPAQRA